ncbi:Histone promoter control protein-like protein [Hapsidospora chrysogenum ATCC 11550]|uniref:Histone promoter control protein-like protein n=1 Tax=Hapsidospora chrysogenum (strain ATCC 11550 / CBS 779.69 / DSM 880 / IAM 14645 / JCM 23072 / IMI 49137) TaxID=857340 RepID=A0A086T345_HAPC1|nr:Histone promoter control protein-like protein [Hapsidospora chrysogenum ATCC 11550]
MDTSARYDSSAGELSSPPSGSLSEPGSPSRQGPAAAPAKRVDAEGVAVKDEPNTFHRNALQYEDVRTVENSDGSYRKRYGLLNGEWVQLTAAGLPRKKPGRKPGTVMKPRAEGADQDAKVRKPRKPRDPNAPPAQRKRKLAPADAGAENVGPSSKVFALGAPNEPTSLQLGAPSSMSPSHRQNQQAAEHHYAPSVQKRDSYGPGSMQNILNAEPASQPTLGAGNGTSSMPVRPSRQSYDPIRDEKYDPVREMMVPSNSGSPRGPSQTANRSPSIASMIEPHASVMRSPGQSQNGYQPSATHARPPGDAMPASPSQPPKTTSNPVPVSRPAGQEPRKDQPSAPPPAPKPVVRESQFTTIASGPVRKMSPKQKPVTGMSTPKTDTLDDLGQEGEGRSILDFGRAKPGEETQTPTIVLNIPIQAGETNKYVNFMRLAEDRFGWDALHPRLAANRDRKARIAAAAASLEKVEFGHESGDDMSVDLSEPEASNAENGATSGMDAQVKPKKKRNFKEDNYDVDDEFVDDSELMWEAQAAASRDGFFVYSGPLVPEVEKPAGHEGPPKRGRGSRGGRGGGRGASTRGGTGSGRGGGPGSRGGSVTRKPRITKSEKAQREREKAERETMAQLSKTPTSGYTVQPTTPAFSVTELGA